MCIVIDTNVIPSVFNPRSSEHKEFQPIFAWIAYGKGKMVYGGTKYIRELTKIRKLRNLLAEWHRSRKVVLINNVSVDAMEQQLSQIITHPKFNDQHIVAIIIVSGCKLVCSNDKNSHTLIKRRILYPKGIHPPKIYSSSKTVHLLCDQYIADCCKPC